MASLVRASWNWLKMAWATQPVLFVSCVLGTAGKEGRKPIPDAYYVDTWGSICKSLLP